MGSIGRSTTIISDEGKREHRSQDINNAKAIRATSPEVQGNQETQKATARWWQVHQPAHAQTPTIPPFLCHVNAKDISILSTPDSEYTTLSWSRVQCIIQENRLDVFQREPSQLYRYLEFNAGLKEKWGSVIRFVVKERLGWDGDGAEAEEEGRFENPRNIKVLWNDWPYGIDGRIVHLVVWTKFVLEDDEATNDLRDDVRAEIEAFVEKVFGSRVGRENVIWFKNWKTLKSVHAVEHFHVMLFDPDLDFVDEVTGGDVPLSKKV